MDKKYRTNKIAVKNENKRYAEDESQYKTIGTYYTKRSRTIYNNLFKTNKSTENLPIGKIRRKLIKSNDDKAFELLRDNSIDHNNYN